MGIGPPRLRRRLIVAVSLLATAGFVAAPASRADTGIGVAPASAVAAPAEVESTVDTVVSSPAEPAVPAPVEAVAALAPPPAQPPSAEVPHAGKLVSLAAPAVASAVAEVESTVVGAALAIPATSRPHAVVAPPSPARTTQARPGRAESVKVAPRRSVQSPSGLPSHSDRRELAIGAGKPLAIPVSSGSDRLDARSEPGPQRIPAPSEPATGGYAAGAAPAVVFLVTMIALFLARSGLGARITSRLASPRSAALALELERPG